MHQPKAFLEAPIYRGERNKARYQEKLLRLILPYPYRKPTQVDKASSLR